MKRFLQQPFLVYLFTGGLNTAISLALFAIMVKLGANYLFASGFVYIFGIIEGYIFSSIWVFKHKIDLTKLFKYSGVYAISFIFNLLLMYIAVDILLLNKVLAQILVTAILTLLNYQLVKILVFKRHKAPAS
jgi:putative flippase GtrA